MRKLNSRIQRLLKKHLNIHAIQDAPYPLQGFVNACQVLIEDLFNQREKMRHSLTLISKELEEKDQKIQAHDKKIESMLLDSLPPHLIKRLLTGEDPVADALPNIHVMVIKLDNFKQISERVGAETLIRFLNNLFYQFDQIIEKYPMQKVRTRGPSYLLISTSSDTIQTDAIQALHTAYALFDCLQSQRTEQFGSVAFKSGIHTGSAVLGVMGNQLLHYDVWGQTVDLAHHMVDNANPNTITITRSTYDTLSNDYQELFSSHESTQLIQNKRILSYQLQLDAQLKLINKKGHPWHDFLQLRHHL